MTAPWGDDDEYEQKSRPCQCGADYNRQGWIALISLIVVIGALVLLGVMT